MEDLQQQAFDQWFETQYKAIIKQATPYELTEDTLFSASP